MKAPRAVGLQQQNCRDLHVKTKDKKQSTGSHTGGNALRSEAFLGKIKPEYPTHFSFQVILSLITFGGHKQGFHCFQLSELQDYFSERKTNKKKKHKN